MKLELLSPNLITIVNEILKNQNIVKLIHYDVNSPLIQPNISDSKFLFMTRILPYRFAGTITEAQTQIRIYYPRTKITNDVIESTTIYFDILCHKDLFLIKDSGSKTLLRPYKIMTEITKQFDKKPIAGVGTLRFEEVNHLSLDNNFSVYTLIATMTTPSGV